jgi:serine/threonine protein kinase
VTTLTGTNIGTYRIESKLGEGGMGMVFLGLDTKLNRPVAVKFLAEDVADAAARRRFQREAQTASSLNHPHYTLFRLSPAGTSRNSQLRASGRAPRRGSLRAL